MKKSAFSLNEGGYSVNEGIGMEFCRKGKSVKRSGSFSELTDSEN